MANPHPNTSGLRPFNKMDPDEAKRIRRLGGLSRAKRYFMAMNLNETLKYAKDAVAKRYPIGYEPERDIITKATEILYDKKYNLSERLKMMKYLESLKKYSYQEQDTMNALVYKTHTPEFQLSDDYDDAFRSDDNNDVQYLEDEMNDLGERKIYDDDDIIEPQCTDTCIETKQ